MPLTTTILKTNLSRIMDSTDPLFTGYPDNATIAIQNFANAINDYAMLVIPVTTPISQELGVQSFVSVMTPLTTPPTEQSPTFMDLFPQALTAYATQLSLGMLPAFTGTPPPVPIQLDTVWQIGLNGGSTQNVINSMVPIIDAWFRTGIAVNTASGVTTTWV